MVLATAGITFFRRSMYFIHSSGVNDLQHVLILSFEVLWLMLVSKVCLHWSHTIQWGSGQDILQDSSTSSLCCRQRTSGCICWCVWDHCPDRACVWWETSLQSMAQGRQIVCSILCSIHYAAEHDKLSGSLFQNPTPDMDFRRVLVPVLQPSEHLLFVKAFSLVAVQLYGWLICVDYAIKCLVLFKVFLAPVQSFSFICIPNHLTVSDRSEGPATLIAKFCKGSHTVLDICCPKRFVRISLRAEAVTSSYPVIASSMQW